MVLIPDDAASDLSDEENTTVGNSGDIFHDQEGDSPKRPYKPKNEFLLCSKEKLEERIRGAECEKKQIAPQQLSTTATAERLELMRTRDLIDSIVTRFRIRNPQVRRVRSSNVTYYNWLLLDLARRVAVVERRLQNEFPHTWEEELRHQVIDPAADRVWWSIKFTKSFAKISEDDEYFDFFPAGLK